MLTSLIFDHYGLLGVPEHPLTVLRALGAAFLKRAESWLAMQSPFTRVVDVLFFCDNLFLPQWWLDKPWRPWLVWIARTAVSSIWEIPGKTDGRASAHGKWLIGRNAIPNL